MSELNSVHKMYFKVFFELFQSRELPDGSRNSLQAFKADFQSVEVSGRIGNPLFARETIALTLNRMLRMTLCKIPSARKILLNGNWTCYKSLSILNTYCKM